MSGDEGFVHRERKDGDGAPGGAYAEQMQSDLLPHEAIAWRDIARGRVSGTVRVEQADVHLEVDASNELAVFLELTLSNPPEGEETWPVADVIDLIEALSAEAVRLGLDLPWRFRFWPVDEEPLDEDEPAPGEFGE
jgi:hypothetical protein